MHLKYKELHKETHGNQEESTKENGGYPVTAHELDYLLLTAQSVIYMKMVKEYEKKFK